MFGDGSLTFQEFAMREPLRLATIQDAVLEFLRGRDDVAVLDAPAVLAEVPGLRSPGPDGRYAQFWPHRHGTDAIFLALLQRHPAGG